MAKCVNAGVLDGHLGDALFASAVETIPFDLRKDVLAALILHCPSFDSGHTILGEKTATIHIGKCHSGRAIFALVLATGALGVEVVVSRCAGNDLALFGHAEPLCKRF